MSDTTVKKVKEALEKHNHGYNCAQAVSCVFCEECGIDEKTMFRLTEGMGLGMGGTEGTCGAITAAALLAGLKNSTCNLEHPDSKAVSYQAAKKCIEDFKEQAGSVICRELKGIETGVVLHSCNDCIADAIKIVGENLYPDEK